MRINKDCEPLAYAGEGNPSLSKGWEAPGRSASITAACHQRRVSWAPSSGTSARGDGGWRGAAGPRRCARWGVRGTRPWPQQWRQRPRCPQQLLLVTVRLGRPCAPALTGNLPRPHAWRGQAKLSWSSVSRGSLTARHHRRPRRSPAPSDSSTCHEQFWLLFKKQLLRERHWKVWRSFPCPSRYLV